MAVAVEIELADGLDRRDYRTLIEELALAEHPPGGLICHVATEREGRLRILEVWESARKYRVYREERLLPNIEFALGEKGAALARESISTEMPVRGVVQPSLAPA